MEKITFERIQKAKKALMRTKFATSKKVLGEGWFGWVFEDGPGRVIKAGFDPSFRSLMTEPERPISPHLPMAGIDFGAEFEVLGLPAHVVSCERLEPLRSDGGAWPVAERLSNMLSKARKREGEWITLMDEMAALDEAAEELSLKLCLRELHSFALSKGWALSPYFGAPQQNLMVRPKAGGMLVFVNPLIDPRIEGIPVGIMEDRIVTEGEIKTDARRRDRMDEDAYRDETGEQL